MPCGTSNSPVTTYSIQYFYNPNCSDCATECGNNTMSSKCVFYAGPALTCSGIATDDSVEVALQKIDEQICSIVGDYSTYQFHCLTTWFGSSITEESEFVDAITGYACEIRTDLDTFIDTTFPAYQGTVNTRFLAIENPAITCSSASVTNADTLIQVLNKYCTKFSQIDTKFDLSTVVWDSCFTVSSPPLTIAEGFTLLADQICQVNSTSSSLPTFDNSSNCLAGGATDSLVDTIALITDRLCSTDVFDSSSISWGCLDDAATTLQAAFQTVVTKVSALQQNFVTFDSGDFVVTATDGGDACQGITVALATPINQDRLVAVDGSDNSPGTLVSKLTAGTGITLTNNGTDLEISASGTADSYEVKADTSDTSPGFLSDKIVGGSQSGITITPNYDSGDEQLQILPQVDLSALFTALLNQLDIDSDLYDLFCSKIAGCPSPCAPPTNVQVSLITTTTTTTTTTVP